MRGQVLRTARVVMIFIILFMLQSSGATQARPVTREPVPDYLAWRMFHESIAFHKQLAEKTLAARATSTGTRTLFSKRPQVDLFDRAMKKQFGLTPEQAQSLLSSGRTYLAGLGTIQSEAKAEVRRRYLTPQALASAARGPQKTIMERSKEDGYHAQVEARRQAALAAHLQDLQRNLAPVDLAKITHWVQTTVASRITITKEMPASRGTAATMR